MGFCWVYIIKRLMLALFWMNFPAEAESESACFKALFAEINNL